MQPLEQQFSLFNSLVGAMARRKRLAVASGGCAGGAARSKSHSLFGHAITGPAFQILSRLNTELPTTRYFYAIGLCAEVNLHLE